MDLQALYFDDPLKLEFEAIVQRKIELPGGRTGVILERTYFYPTGGGQEHGFRAGTQNVPYIVGFAEALRLAHEERPIRTGHVKPLRDRIIGRVLEEIPDSLLTGHPEHRLRHVRPPAPCRRRAGWSG